MNTVKSTWLGWGSLCVAGGTAYYLAKRSINADRQARHEEDLKRRRQQEALEHSSRMAASGALREDRGGAAPSHKASKDPAATRHAPETEEQRIFEKSKYEASEPFRSRKGDRFS